MNDHLSGPGHDFPARLGADLLRLAAHVRRTHGVVFATPLRKPPKQRSRAADRTRSKRYRAGTRRTRRQVQNARKAGLPHPLAANAPFTGWHQMGCMIDDGLGYG